MTDAVLQAIRERMQAARASAHSTFYRDLYATYHAEFPRTPAEWYSLTPLTKADILRVPFFERVFVPRTELDSMRTTSGTTATGTLSLPRIFDTPETYESKGIAHALRGTRSLLTFFVSHHRFVPALPDLEVIGADPARLDVTARFAAQRGVDALHGQPSMLLSFAETLAKHYSLERIAVVLTSMERLNALQAQALRTLFPNARLSSAYGSTEQQGWGAFSPQDPMPGAPLALEGTPDFYFEIINDDGSVVEETGVTGELLVTILSKHKGFPLFRYRSNDRAEWVRLPQTFVIHGRSTGDRVRIPGGQLMLAELERVLGTIPGVVDFEGIVEDVLMPLPKPRLTLVLYIHGTTSREEELSHLIARVLRINQNRSYLDGVEKGLYAPLVVRIERTMATPQTKRRGLKDIRP